MIERIASITTLEWSSNQRSESASVRAVVRTARIRKNTQPPPSAQWGEQKRWHPCPQRHAPAASRGQPPAQGVSDGRFLIADFVLVLSQLFSLLLKRIHYLSQEGDGNPHTLWRWGNVSMAARGLTQAQGVSACCLLIDAFLFSLLPSHPSNIKTDFFIEPI